MSARAGLAVENLSIAFADGDVSVVRDVSFGIAPGEALGLVGESGSGKSLTARAILGLLPTGAAVTGRVRLDDVSLLDLPRRRRESMRGSRIAMIFQDPMSSLNPVLRVGDAVAQVIRSHDEVDERTARRRAIEMLEKVGIHDAPARARFYPHEFSGGMRQRIMIAMALAANPSMLLADEPTTALDVIVQAEILRLIDRLRRTESMSLLFVSHDLAVVAQMCDRIAVMYAGRIVEEGPAGAVLAAPRMPYSIGLMESIPGPVKKKRLSAIPGLPPVPGEVGAGCSFAPRCRIASEICRTTEVAMVGVGPNHRARCLKTAEIAPAGDADPADRDSGAWRSAVHDG
jgi:peptide/nickel transport system ATP-binding protein